MGLTGAYRPDDLAVIRADDPEGLTPARFGDSSRARAGDAVLAVGNPLGPSGSVTEGIISATGRAVTEPGAGGSPGVTLPDSIQTSAPGQTVTVTIARDGQTLRIGVRLGELPGG
jgi:S1-C subfamily serine protease